ncbi:MAG: hypothetical protein IJ489_08225 [Clostridia bacterium]|nr:hypothetical protein [Clostridia bacterium]
MRIIKVFCCLFTTLFLLSSCSPYITLNNNYTQDSNDGNLTWIPNDNEPWNFTAIPVPALGIPENAIFDYEIELSNEKYTEVPEYIECEITNHSGDGVYLSNIYIEKWYSNVEHVNTEEIIPESATPGWVRIPFIMEGYYLNGISPSVKQGKIELEKYLKTDYQYTSGSYRIVFPLNDGTYYAYFEITE